MSKRKNKPRLSAVQRELIDVAQQICDDEDRSTEYMLQYCSDMSGADYDDVVDYILMRADKHEKYYRDIKQAEHLRKLAAELTIRSPIIFDPTDPRVEIGREYDFCNVYTFAENKYHRRGILKAVYVGDAFPFEIGGEREEYFDFIREVQK